MPIMYVDASRPDDTGDGLSEGAAKKTIRNAIAAMTSNGWELRIKRGQHHDPLANVFNYSFPAGLTDGLLITPYGTGADPIWDGVNYEPANAVGWTYLSNGIWKKQFGASGRVRRLFGGATNTGFLIGQRTIGTALRRAPVNGGTSWNSNNTEADIITGITAAGAAGPWAAGGSTTTYHLYVWTGSAVTNPPAYYGGLAFMQESGPKGAFSGLIITNSKNIRVENQQFWGFDGAAVIVNAYNTNARNVENVELVDLTVKYWANKAIIVDREYELAPTWGMKNILARRINCDAMSSPAEQELTVAETIYWNRHDAFWVGSGTNGMVIENCSVKDAGHTGIAVQTGTFLMPAENVLVQDNVLTSSSWKAYGRAFGHGFGDVPGMVFRRNKSYGQPTRSQFQGRCRVESNEWWDMRTSPQKADIDNAIAVEAYDSDNGNGLGGAAQVGEVRPIDVQIIGNYFQGAMARNVFEFNRFDAVTWGTVNVANNVAVQTAGTEAVRLENYQASPSISVTFNNNTFYKAGLAGGTNRVHWEPTTGSVTNYAVSAIPGGADNNEVNPQISAQGIPLATSPVLKTGIDTGRAYRGVNRMQHERNTPNRGAWATPRIIKI